MNEHEWHDEFSLRLYRSVSSSAPILARNLRVFSRDRTAKDEVPRDVAIDPALADLTFAGIPTGILEEFRPGALVFEDSRLLMSDLGQERGRMYAVPTSKGGICLTVTSIGSSACVERLYGGIFLNAHQQSLSSPLYVYGLLDDGVERVQLVAGRHKYDTSVGENAFFGEIPSHGGSAIEISSARLFYADGASTSVGFS